MANLNETPKWEDSVYQMETSDPVLGGPGGIANKQAEQLSNRTSWLKQQTENIQSNLSDVATSGSYSDLSDKPQIMIGATALSDGEQGFVPLPKAGDEKKVLTGDGKWVFMSGMPVGVPFWFAGQTPPVGCLVCDGAAVSRVAYPDLYAVTGTKFGTGDGSTTFNVPDLINRFAQGSLTPGQKIEAGLPDHNHTLPLALEETGTGYAAHGSNISSGTTVGYASASNPIYGASNTVQPPALTLLPCIKAFDTATNPGLIDITELANEMAGKVDRYIDNKPVRYVIDTFDDGTNWYRKWSDGWLEQGGLVKEITDGKHYYNLLLPYRDSSYQVLTSILTSAYFYIGAMPHTENQYSYEGIGHTAGAALAPYYFYWQTTGRGV